MKKTASAIKTENNTYNIAYHYVPETLQEEMEMLERSIECLEKQIEEEEAELAKVEETRKRKRKNMIFFIDLHKDWLRFKRKELENLKEEMQAE